MSSQKSVLVVLLLTAALCLVPLAQASIVIEGTMAGSSGAWQAAGVAAYNYCLTLAGTTSTCSHWTSASNTVNLTDTRVTPVNNDPGTLWVVWETTIATGAVSKLWSDDKVDTVVGNRCFFAQPQCNVNATAANLAGSGAGQISSSIWGADTALPATVQAIFEAGTKVNELLTDVRPEDAAFEACRVNSALGGGTYADGAGDGLDGLGYNTNNASGVCPTTGLTQAHYVGTPIQTALPGSTSVANVLSFNISGVDPISGTTIPTSTVVELGADAVMFFFERNEGQLNDLKDVSVLQLQEAFSGTNCDASAFGLAAGKIGIFLREPLSGTMIATELTTFRGQTAYNGAGGGGTIGVSQEANVNGGTNNPLNGQAGTCLAGTGARYRGVGAGDIDNWVLKSGSTLGVDGIGYQFYSFGNVSKFANNPAYGYATVGGVDPIFQSYGNQVLTGTPLDPGQPLTAGTMPGAATLPASCGGAFPCSEKAIWAGGLSFPNVRNGSYKSWSIIRGVAYAAQLADLKALIKGAQVSVVDDVPDFVPAVKTVGKSTTDPGLTILRSHLQQLDGAGTLIGAAPVNGEIGGATEKGGDGGGQILTCPTPTTCPNTTGLLQSAQGQQAR